MDRSFVEQNAAARERLKAILARLSPADLDRPVGGGWTIKATLAHLAHWDRWVVSRLEEWEREGVQVTPVDPDPINAEGLSRWLAIPAAEAAREVVAAAEAVGRKIASLPPDLVAEIFEKRPRMLIRAIHRGDHLDEIERALPRGLGGGALMEETVSPSEGINQAQELNLKLIEAASFNQFDGRLVGQDLREHKRLWDAALMTRPHDLIMLRDLPGGYWNVDTLYLLTDESRLDELERLVRERWKAGEIARHDLDETSDALGEDTGLVGTKRILAVWWD